MRFMVDAADIFARLKRDHDIHRSLLGRLADAQYPGKRKARFEEHTFEVKGHAAAEEQAVYSTMMRKPETTDETRHSVAEHHEIEEMLNDVAAADPATGGWLVKFRGLKDKYLHHIEEEEEEMFPRFAKELTEEDAVYMRTVFERRKAEEKDKAEVTPEKMEDAKE
jgi:hypothetical protein